MSLIHRQYCVTPLLVQKGTTKPNMPNFCEQERKAIIVNSLACEYCEHLERKQKDEGHIITHGSEVLHEVGVEDNMRVIVNKESTQLNHFFCHLGHPQISQLYMHY